MVNSGDQVSFFMAFQIIKRIHGEVFMDLKDFFDNQATSWDENQALYRPHPEELLDALRLRPGEDVLEIGCGSGWLMEPLACKIAPGRLYALDFSGEMLRQAAAREMNY